MGFFFYMLKRDDYNTKRNPEAICPGVEMIYTIIIVS
jgi:hypothetical protein